MEENVEFSSVLIPVLGTDRSSEVRCNGKSRGEGGTEPGACFTVLGEPIRDKEPIVSARLCLPLKSEEFTYWLLCLYTVHFD